MVSIQATLKLLNKYIVRAIMVKRIFICFVFVLLSALISAQLPAGFIRERIATGLNPTSMVLAPDGRIFITEKNGKVRIIRDGKLLDEPLLSLEVDDTNERGLGHIVLHPDFENNGYFYVFYTVPVLRLNRVSRFTANGDKAIPGSELIIINMDETGSDIHNGGAMLFGLDGYLYISTGEGAQSWKSEDLGSTNGKVLRVDESGIPVPDNPWYDLNTGRSNMVYSYGLRNPFTMVMNPLTGEIYVGDVGNMKFEEVNKIEKGAFYGWPKVEGKAHGEILPDEYKDPIYQYEHKNNYCCIVGATFYDPEIAQFPASFEGIFFYNDYCTGHIRMLDVDTGIDHGIFISDGDRVVDMRVSSDGSLFYLERKGLGDGSQEDNTSTTEGALWKVSYIGTGKPYISVHPESALTSAGEDAFFNVKAFGANPLSYRWFLNGDEISGNNEPAFEVNHTTIDQDSSSIVVIVGNSFGEARSDTAYLNVTINHRPEAVITNPVEGSTYNGGQIISFGGFGQDEEDGIIPESALSWRIDFQHGTHSHPGMPWLSGVSAGTWMIPSAGETSSDVWYRVYLKVTDTQGLSKIEYRDIFPQLGNIKVRSIPDGLNINLDGTPSRTPYEFEGVEGISRYLSAPVKQIFGDSIYFFNNWNEGSKILNMEVKARQDDQLIIGTFDGITRGKGIGLTAKYFDNINFQGNPILIKIDSVINHQFFSGQPDPLVPADNFGITWDGYLQAYRSGIYNFTVIADDGIFLKIDDHVLVDKLEDGVHTEKSSLYLESGHLYPVKMKMFDGYFNAQIKLRWSGVDFGEEVIPSYQLYPADYLTEANSSAIISLRTLSANEFLVIMESYKETKMDFTIVSVIGQSFVSHDVDVHIGKNEIPFDISGLPAGIYFLTGIDQYSGKKTVEKFVKVN